MMETRQRKHASRSLLQAYGDALGRHLPQRAAARTSRDARSRAERATAAAQRAVIYAKTANRAKSEFLASMSHELRTPLNAIVGFSELIERDLIGPGKLRDRYADYVHDIMQAGQHLLGLVNDILDLAKVEAGRMDLREQPCDIGECIATSIKLVASQAERGKVTLDWNRDVQLPAFLGDEKKLRQILINLLSNAVKFTPPGGAVGLLADIEPEGGLRIRVRDTGIGISSKDLARVFEPFTQAESGRPLDFGGTGLGLSLCKAMTELHGGEISIESELDLGTTVTLRFPAERMRAAAA